MQESRRSARVSTPLSVAVTGVDEIACLRSGNISATGVYFEYDRDIGDIGSLQWLHLGSVDGQRKIDVMALVARVLDISDLAGRVRGVALQFMPRNEAQATELQGFVQYVLRLEPAPASGEASKVVHEAGSLRGPHLQPRLHAWTTPEGGAGSDATLDRLSVRSMLLETTMPFKAGDQVRVEVSAPGMTHAVRLKGRAVAVSPALTGGDKPRYQIEVEVHDEKGGPLLRSSSLAMPAVNPNAQPSGALSPAPASGPMSAPPPSGRPAEDPTDDDFVSRTLEQLFSALIEPKRPGEEPVAKPRHLSGQLDRVRLPALLALFEMQKMTGVLIMHSFVHTARVFIREGDIVDVEPRLASESTARDAASRVFRWDVGSFDFEVGPVEREDKIGMSVTALLLDLARESDEKAR